MSRNYKRILTAGLLALVLGVSSLVANKTNAVFPGPDATNGRLVWATDGGHTIRVAQPNGTGVVNLYNDNAAEIMGDPVWSPDQSKIAFVVAKAGQTHIYTINGTDSNQTPTALTSGAGQSGGTDPSWSPDGQHIVFSRAVSGVGNIFIMDDDGANQTQLTNYTDTDVQAYDPSWSPKTASMQIVYTRAAAITSPPDDADTMIAVINGTFDGLTTNVELAQANSDIRGEYDAQFDPTGDKVLFVRKTPGGFYSIGWVLADGSSSAYTTEVPGTVLNGPVYDPAYSPDGKKIIYVKTANLLTLGPLKIYDPESGSETQFSSTGAEPDWTYATTQNPPTDDLPDVSITCTTKVGTACTTSIPAYCTNTLLTSPLYGQSTVTQGDPISAVGSMTYTPVKKADGSWNKADENYAYVRSDGTSTAKCNVRIVFTDDNVVANIPKTGVVGGLVGVGLAAAVAGGVIYAKEHKNKKAKELGSEK